MKAITPKDRSILALLAASGRVSPRKYRPLIAKLTSDDAHEIAFAILGLKGDVHFQDKKVSEPAKKTARALLTLA